jgi:hypothetical protein
VQQQYGVYRFASGFFLWRLGANGCLYDPWQSQWGDAYHPFDSHCGEWGSLCTPASHDWPTLNTTVILEGIREGIQDYRHLITLERLLKENPNHPQAASCREFLQKLRDSIKPDGEHYFERTGWHDGGWDHTWQQKDTFWTSNEYNSNRRTIADFISEMQKQ